MRPPLDLDEEAVRGFDAPIAPELADPDDDSFEFDLAASIERHLDDALDPLDALDDRPCRDAPARLRSPSTCAPAPPHRASPRRRHPRRPGPTPRRRHPRRPGPTPRRRHPRRPGPRPADDTLDPAPRAHPPTSAPPRPRAPRPSARTSTTPRPPPRHTATTP
ncbi:MAG: hypothetical protein H6701_13490 [Myxococcales bacterium]|nr:hypothetical protein [Myxococcales bacterium]